jgi:uncharacterized protein YbaR (Trm112 family)
MISDEFLRSLRCPATAEPLALADDALVAKLNKMVEQGKLRSRAGDVVSRRLDEGLIAKEAGVVYPVADEIPDLVSDDAIPLDQLDAPP